MGSNLGKHMRFAFHMRLLSASVLVDSWRVKLMELAKGLTLCSVLCSCDIRSPAGHDLWQFHSLFCLLPWRDITNEPVNIECIFTTV